MTAESPAAPLTFREVLRLDVMRRLWYAQIVSLLGDFLALFAVISVVSFRMHGTPGQITGVQIAYMLPLTILGPLSGVFVDRWPLKPTLIASDVIRAGLAVLLMFSTSIPQVYAVLLGLSSVSSFFLPAQSVTIRTHVPREGLLSANALMQLAMMGIRILGPASAGALVAAFGPNLCYQLDVVSFLASATLIGSVAIRRPEVQLKPDTTRGPDTTSVSPLRKLLHDMLEGLRFILHHPAVQFVVLAMAASLFTAGCFGPLIAIYVRDWLHASSAAFGMVSAGIGVGMFAGTPVVRSVARVARNETMVLAGLAGIGGGALLLGLSTTVPLAFLATFAIGFAFAAVIVPAQTLLQQETPHEMMGRVSSSVTAVVFTAQVLGLVLSGGLADLLGVRLVFIACAGLGVGMAALGRLLLAGRSAATASSSA